MKKSCVFIIALFIAAAPAFGQSDPFTNGITSFYEGIRLNLIETADLVSDGDYSFRPTAEVRSIAQLIGHIANSQYFFCSTAAGEDSPNAVDYENDVTDKAGLVQGLKGSFEYCDGVYASMTDATAAEDAGGERTRMWGLVFNVAHNNEHYGNLVTYMRLRGMVPPSTARTQ